LPTNACIFTAWGWLYEIDKLLSSTNIVYFVYYPCFSYLRIIVKSFIISLLYVIQDSR